MTDLYLSVLAISDLESHGFESYQGPGSHFMWLRDALPYDLVQGDDTTSIARVMTYGYDSRIVEGIDMQNLETLGASLHNSLLALISPNMKPIILIAYGLGGLIVKQVTILQVKPRITLTPFRLSSRCPSRKAKTTKLSLEQFLVWCSLGCLTMAWRSAHLSRWLETDPIEF